MNDNLLKFMIYEEENKLPEVKSFDLEHNHSIIKLKNQNVIVMWSFKSKKLKMIDLFDEVIKKDSVITIYKFEQKVKLVKLTVINEKEYLLVCDKPGYIKLLYLHDKKCYLRKEYYVYTNFGYQPEIDISNATLSDGVLMMDQYILQ